MWGADKSLALYGKQQVVLNAIFWDFNHVALVPFSHNISSQHASVAGYF
jgi:hypothetical protein